MNPNDNPSEGTSSYNQKQDTNIMPFKKEDSNTQSAYNKMREPYRSTSNINAIENDIQNSENSENNIDPENPPSWEQLTKKKYADDLARAEQTNKKVAKTAVKGAATYFGGPIGGAAANIINDSKIADPVYDRIAEATSKLTDSNPLTRHVQKKINEADDAGVIDMADSAISLIGSKGAPSADAAQAASGAQAASTSAETATKGAETATEGAEAAQENLPNQNSTPNQQALNEEAAEKANTAVAEAEKEKQEKKKKKGVLLNIIRTNPMLLIILLGAGVLFLLFILLMSFLLGEGGVLQSEESQSSSIDERYDFTKATITLTNSYNNAQNRVELQQLTLDDLIKGAAYAELYNSLEGLTYEQMVELFSANMIVFRALALNIGNYDSSNKEIELQSGNNGIPYCDLINGCDIVNSEGLNTYLITTYSGEFKGTKTGSIPAPNTDIIMALNEAYNNTKYLLLVPSSFNELLTKYDMGNPPYTQAIKQNMINKATNSKTYETIIKEISEYNNYKIYDLEKYAISYTYADNNTAYWWPLGGSQDASGLYSGTASWTRISSPYGSRIHPITGKSSFHSGIDIPASQGTPIIATRSGTVTIATYHSSYGNYVEINHGDGTSSRYAHMMNGGIMVKVGQSVTQGQIIGKVGTTGASTGNHLHFEIRIDGKTTDPTQYVDAQNQRPRQITGITGVVGSNNAQSICLTLKNSGFSDSAVAALMTNIDAESGFRLNALGDSGTSYGLVQWHNGRYTNLRNHCGSNLNSVECQIDYLLYELTTSYRDVYSNLLSNGSAYDKANYFCLHFESPKNSTVVCPERASSDSAKYFTYVTNGCR